ncbi:hypothetical protein OIO90_000198 [Microbotryomycetes sp. JL221]|nr:hypothetical protein OIO90_000198 [Microbotryomycetes sp. JL221]
MFSFAFDIDESELDQDLAESTASLHQLRLDQQQPEASTSALIPHSLVDRAELIEELPPSLSYTPVVITGSNSSITLLRRDLYDARFQVISLQDQRQEDEEDVDGASPTPNKGKAKETYIDKDTDLVKGVYEGGLKTWECSLDLVRVTDELAFQGKRGQVRGTSVIELGCGTALPLCGVFARLLAEIRKTRSQEEESESDRPAKTQLHFQDYNKQVLSLITLPNILLTYAQHLATPLSAPDADEDPEPTLPGELDVTPEFLDSFEAFLDRENIEILFSEGDWGDLAKKSVAKYDIVLTSETVYSLDSLPSLLDVLSATCVSETTCLVACKRIYFGVGGGELEFRRRAEERGCKVETVWPKQEGAGLGVSRVVMEVSWSDKKS